MTQTGSDPTITFSFELQQMSHHVENKYQNEGNVPSQPYKRRMITYSSDRTRAAVMAKPLSMAWKIYMFMTANQNVTLQELWDLESGDCSMGYDRRASLCRNKSHIFLETSSKAKKIIGYLYLRDALTWFPPPTEQFLLSVKQTQRERVCCKGHCTRQAPGRFVFKKLNSVMNLTQ